MGNRRPHSATKRGRRVRIRLKDGTIIDDRFASRTDRWVVLKEYGRVYYADLDSFQLLKEPSGSDKRKGKK